MIVLIFVRRNFDLISLYYARALRLRNVLPTRALLCILDRIEDTKLFAAHFPKAFNLLTVRIILLILRICHPVFHFDAETVATDILDIAILILHFVARVRCKVTIREQNRLTTLTQK